MIFVIGFQTQEGNDVYRKALKEEQFMMIGMDTAKSNCKGLRNS